MSALFISTNTLAQGGYTPVISEITAISSGLDFFETILKFIAVGIVILICVLFSLRDKRKKNEKELKKEESSDSLYYILGTTLLTFIVGIISMSKMDPILLGIYLVCLLVFYVGHYLQTSSKPQISTGTSLKTTSITIFFAILIIKTMIPS